MNYMCCLRRYSICSLHTRHTHLAVGLVQLLCWIIFYADIHTNKFKCSHKCKNGSARGHTNMPTQTPGEGVKKIDLRITSTGTDALHEFV